MVTSSTRKFVTSELRVKRIRNVFRRNPSSARSILVHDDLQREVGFSQSDLMPIVSGAARNAAISTSDARDKTALS
jgi:hypothetical protein